jgi:hypothetical protein
VLPGIVIAIWAIHVISLSSFRFGVPTLPLTYVIVSGPVAALVRRGGQALRLPVVAVGAWAIAGVAVAAQYHAWPLRVAYEAVELDGLRASNEPDAVAGRPVRVADAKRGERPVVLLADEYLPAGRLTATIRARRTSDGADGPALRVVLYHLDGTPAGLSDVSSRDLSRDHFVDVDVACHLRSDGPATLAVVTLGAADVAVERVILSWHQ